jgi:predicted glycoside hydrolase/deacetylase ChbG (UPF0249 family)
MIKNIDVEKLNKISKLIKSKNLQIETRVIVDDTAATSDISNVHLELIKNAQINGCSILANGPALETVRQGLQNISFVNRTRVSYSIHLDICEGRPTMNSNVFPMKIDKFGNFNYSYFLLLFDLLLSTKSTKKQKLTAIENEWRNQISSIQNYFKDIIDFSGVDSHRHFHTNPFLLRISKDLAEEFGLNLRIPKEKYYLIKIREFFSKKYLIGISKLTLLNVFLRNESQEGNYFLGVLHSGDMTANKVISGILKIVSSSRDGESVVIDILFHPGRDLDSINDSSKKTIFRKWYSSHNRELELQEIMKLRAIIDSQFSLPPKSCDLKAY